MLYRTRPDLFLDTQSPPVLLNHYSADFQVRLKASQIASCEWVHLETSWDGEHLITDERIGACGGITEWVSSHQGQVLTLGWDWAVCDDGELIVRAEVAPRTNILTISRQGYDVAPDANITNLWLLIMSIPWKHEVKTWINRQQDVNPPI
jgi:hypothetical protein